jgi:hypothetical protein
MESWRKVWRDGFLPQFSTRSLLALQRGLKDNDGRLTQGATSIPAPHESVLDWPIEGACVLGFGAWQGDGVETVGDLESHFAEACFEADRRLGEPAAVRYFLNWYDDVPRDVMRRELLAEISRELPRRHDADIFAPRRRKHPEFVAA